MSLVDAFPVIVIGVSVVSAVIAAVDAARANALYRKVGRLGDLWLDTDDGLSAPTRAMIREEVEQMVDAISAARQARGERSRS
jgi:methionine synthase II (cobalamin-independent)